MTSREQAYLRKVEQLLERVGHLREAEVGRVLAILEQARAQVAVAVTSTDWKAHYLPQKREAVARAIEAFSQRYRVEQDRALGNAWNAGYDMVDSPLNYADLVHSALPELSRTALEIAQGYSADLIHGLAGDALKRINSEITLGVMGDKSLAEVMQAIGHRLDSPGVFGTVANRAEAITRTEFGRVNSLARQARIHDVVRANPGVWLKQWLHSGKPHPRPRHLVLDRKAVPLDEDFPGGIPYPHAPGLPAAEVVNCGCSHVLTRLDWDDLPQDWDPRPYQDRAIYD